LERNESEFVAFGDFDGFGEAELVQPEGEDGLDFLDEEDGGDFLDHGEFSFWI
jgi:hypothetical protein